jgi:hypothetical protein
MCDWRNAFPECRRLSVLDALEKGADLGGVAGVADAPLAACMRIFYPPDSAPGILGIPRA